MHEMPLSGNAPSGNIGQTILAKVAILAFQAT
jgi:hypothetical protein